MRAARAGPAGRMTAFYMLSMEPRPQPVVRRVARAALGLAVALVLAIAMTWPLAAGFGTYGRTPRRRRRRDVCDLERQLGGARADVRSSAALRRQHLSSAPLGPRLLGAQHRRRHRRHSGLAADAESAGRPQLGAAVRVLHVDDRRLAARAAPDRQSTARRSSPPSCSASVRTSFPTPPTSSC